MIKVVLLGSGNVAVQLAKAFHKNENVEVLQVYYHTKLAKYFKNKNIECTQEIYLLKDAHVYILCLSDDVISTFSKKIDLPTKLVVHTSGSVAMNDLECNARKGVFYPLQTISKDKKMSFKKVPLCLEWEHEKDKIILEKLANSITKNVYYLDSSQRKQIHTAAVFINNFTNEIYQIAHDICKENDIPFELLHPLMLETTKKAIKTEPKLIQTGPAKRNDKTTIKKHLNLLNEKQQKVYKVLTNSIRERHANK